MSTTLLDDIQVDFLRSIKKTAIVLLAMGLIDARYPGRAVKVEEMASLLDLDERTCTKHMQSLASRNRLLFNGIGYVLTEGGRAYFLGSAPAETFEALALAHGTQAQALQAPEIVPAQAAQFVQNTQIVQHTLCALEVEDSFNLKNKLNTSSTSDSEFDAQNVQAGQTMPTVADILAATPVLFPPNGVVANGLDLYVLDATEVLAVLAHVYDQRGIFQRPGGMAYSMLKKEQHARQVYRMAPSAYLPNEFLEMLHLAIYVCDECGEKFEKHADIERHAAEQHPPESTPASRTVDVISPTVTTIIHGKLTADAAWRAVQFELERDMPKASFQTWVRDTRAVCYDGNTLTVGAHNAYARDWLESRLTSTVQNLLVGILAQEVTVEFVVSNLEEADDDQG
jgi:hypothetical protein